MRPYSPHDYDDQRNWPLSRGQERKLKERNPELWPGYESWLQQYDSQQRTLMDEAYEVSSERLKERIDELEERLNALETSRRERNE